MSEGTTQSGDRKGGAKAAVLELSAQQLAERRAWRLAFLLTQDADTSVRLVMDLVKTHPGLASMPPAMRDRMLIQHLRELGGLSAGGAGAPTLASMPAQAREAFVLARVDRVDDLWMAQAMDCSKTAARVHLQAAEEMFRRAGASPDEEAAALERAASALSPDRIGETIAQEREQRRRRARRRVIVACAIGAVVLSVGLLVALSWGEMSK